MQPENRRSFVKKSVATTISLSSATFFSSLIRARGDEGGETTTEVFETTFATTEATTELFTTTFETTSSTLETTIDFFETTVGTTTETTTNAPYLMLCAFPVDTVPEVRLAFQLPDGQGGVSSLVFTASITTTKFADPPDAVGYLTCSFYHNAQASVEKPIVTDSSDIISILYFDRGLSADCDATTGNILISEVPALSSLEKTTRFTYGGNEYELAIVLKCPIPSGGFVTTEMWALLAELVKDSAGVVVGKEIVVSYPQAIIGQITPPPSVDNIFISKQ